VVAVVVEMAGEKTPRGEDREPARATMADGLSGLLENLPPHVIFEGPGGRLYGRVYSDEAVPADGVLPEPVPLDGFGAFEVVIRLEVGHA